MNEAVPLKTLPLGIAFPALLADVPLLARVNFLMLCELSFVSERFFALRTREWLLILVNFHVT